MVTLWVRCVDATGSIRLRYEVVTLMLWARYADVRACHGDIIGSLRIHYGLATLVLYARYDDVTFSLS